MGEEGSPPELPDFSAEWRTALAERSTRERVYATALQLYEPTPVSDVAERADVSVETTREYLRWFAELGVLDRIAESPELYSRNDSYFRWRRVQRLRTRPSDELERELDDLAERERAFRDRFDADGPDAVDATEHADYDDFDAVWSALREWETVRQRMRAIERARREGTRASESPA